MMDRRNLLPTNNDITTRNGCYPCWNSDVPADQGGPQLPQLPAPIPDPEQDIEVLTPPGLDSIVPTPSLISSLSS